ncbi:methylenetetrahydrofolate reductase C-terminal domain-containing protein [Sulfuriferula plumbiphila]|nr:methylenetetrahydrofolate reductase C-terminal domain-containing protein [Sulfuriferula plumbiphila]
MNMTESMLVSPPDALVNVNAIRHALTSAQFFWTLEFVPSVDKVLRDELNKIEGLLASVKNYPLIAGFSVSDRVHSDRDPDPVTAASHLAMRSGKQPLVHWSGKGRDIMDLHKSIARMGDMELENMLLLTGDKLKEAAPGDRHRYLESVPAVEEVKRFNPNLLVAVALNPFKYREEDCMAQYLKLGKKVGAGADYVVTQIGFDNAKYQEARDWVEKRNYQVPLVANLMPMLAKRARYMRKHQLAGVTVTDSFLALLEEEEKLPDQGVGRSMRRFALQIIGMRFLGYAGVQLTGIHTSKQFAHLQSQVAELNDFCKDENTWRQAWQECMSFPQGGMAETAPPRAWYLSGQRVAHASVSERLKYRIMEHTHDFMFSNGPGAWLFGKLMRPIRPRHGKLDHAVERFERMVKSPLFGCETCGMCRLAATQYVCPETCPKGLANGPCGGTIENLCEFRDRECIHSVKYRIAKDAGVLDQLETWLVPAVPKEIRHSSSYPPHFRGEGPEIRVVQFKKPLNK